ncbi:hypothetical protein [Aequorivita marisscotiae]|uniref:Uncharacterized protein n=1 Tax=Aequorivita marisscotiae TaxID=3040348 RepID=A0ABY8KUH2_9FLAO|nr:hypothetical protein [Aequorivita sp. Ant34-E75]WGF91810.1 hypothetical protein QCQ61_11385 [Aequorivita sp. Ant34-E75]
MTNIECIKNITTKTVDNFTVPVSMENCELLPVLKHFRKSQSNAVETYLGKENEEVAYYDIEFGVKKLNAIKIWTANNKIIKIDLIKTFSNTEKVVKKLQQLPKSNTKLNYYYDVIYMEDKAWIYPENGIAVFLGLTDGVVNFISYFPPTTIENYINHLHSFSAPREF